MSLAPPQALIAEVARGRPVIVVDDEDRENEGDLIVPADAVTPEIMAFVIRHTGGVVCLALTCDQADDLDLPPMVSENTAAHGTAFTVSVDATHGISTGISAADRAQTVRSAVAPGAMPSDLARPGHVFPLRAADGGVLTRRGHTEAAVDLARLAGRFPAAILSELTHDDGTVRRAEGLDQFARSHGIMMGSIADLIAHRRATEIP